MCYLSQEEHHGSIVTIILSMLFILVCMPLSLKFHTDTGFETSAQATPVNGSVRQGSLRSGIRSNLIRRAAQRTLRMTIVIVVTFIVCWTPYAIALIWEQLDSASLERTLPPWLRDFLYTFAVTSSCVNPFVHSYHIFESRTLRNRIRIPSLRGSTHESTHSEVKNHNKNGVIEEANETQV